MIKKFAELAYIRKTLSKGYTRFVQTFVYNMHHLQANFQRHSLRSKKYIYIEQREEATEHADVQRQMTRRQIHDDVRCKV